MKRRQILSRSLWMQALVLTFVMTSTGCGKETLETTAVDETATSETIATFESMEVEELVEREPSTSGKFERTVTYISSMDMEKYTEDSWNAFTEFFGEAYAEYLEGANDVRCDELQCLLEKERAHLQFRPSQDPGHPLFFRELTKDEIVAEMGTGWNLGNTMDGHSGFTPNETLWQDDETTQQLITAIHDLGFNTVRIPVTWGTMIEDDYSIRDSWISRVQDIADYCINEDMYVIIDIHHDGADQAGWLNISSEDMDLVYEEYEEVWRNIANRFKDYDEHLIMESMNEVYGVDSTVQKDNEIINNLNQIFVNVVRTTGSNNERRWLSVAGRYANVEHTANCNYGFCLPEDVIENRLFVSVHFYDYNFGMEESLDTVSFGDRNLNYIETDCLKLYKQFTSQGIPVIMSEYGAVNKNNKTQRAYHNEIFNYLMHENGIVPVYWDQGWYDRSVLPADFSFSLVDRKTGKPIEKEVTDGLMRGYFAGLRIDDVSKIIPSPEINEISLINSVEKEVSMTIGDVYQITTNEIPTFHNDVLLWKSEDSRIATVYNGKVIARGIGTTKVTVFSQSGSASEQIEITVLSKESETPVKEIYPVSATMEMKEGEYAFIECELEGGDENTFLTYRALDPEIISVSRLGKIVAKKEGSTEVIITASTGMETNVLITVEGVEAEKELQLAVNVLYNDEEKDFHGNEIGERISVSKDGEYTLTFDCQKDLSKEAQKVGIDGLKHLTAIYIKDYAVSSGEATTSPIVSCDIVYQSVVVDGVELTLNSHERKTALKSSGILDTNDPINSWDGSIVKEVTCDSHILDFTIEGIEKPQTITIRFTLCNLVMKE